MSKISLKASTSQSLHQRKKKVLDVDTRLKPFGFCCSISRFNPLSKYDQRLPPYESSLTAITSLHECPVSKIQTRFFTPRLSREKKKLTKSRVLETGDQQRLEDDKLNSFRINRSSRSVKWYLEDEIALAKSIFWTEKQRIYDEKWMDVVRGKEQVKKRVTHLKLQYPRWYQDFSPNQMRNLLNLENVLRTDYEETTTAGTQKSLMAIGVVSTFFTLKPIVIKELHKSCKLNGVDFLREIYRMLTGNDFLQEGYKKYYDCNERIILSGIAFLTLPQTVEELHKRLPAITMPKLPPKPKPPTCLPRRRDCCPYKEELFRRPDWAGYRNKLQKWQRQYKLLAIPKIILPLQRCNQFFNNDVVSDVKKIQKQEDEAEPRLKTDSTKELQKTSATKLDHSSIRSIDHQMQHCKKDFSKQESLEMKKSAIDTAQLPDRAASVPKPPRACRKSWLGEKDAHYVITGAYSDPTDHARLIYEISGVANVTPSNSDERFFAVLKRDEPRKVFPTGRENLSRNWQEWLQNVDEEFKEKEDEADELIKSIESITKLAFPTPVCDSCCLCRQTRKTREEIRQRKEPHLLIDNIVQNGEKHKYVVGSMAMHSPGPSPTESPTDLLERIAPQDEIKTNIVINGVTTQNGTIQYHILGVQKDEIHVSAPIRELPAPKPVIRNVPPCACAIQRISKDDQASLINKDDISWTKDEGLCPGKKYRPNEPGAYSCKKYPGDKSCRRNPFMKRVLKMRMKKEEKPEVGERKETAEAIDTLKGDAQTTRGKRKDKFIPDLNYPAYDHPWNISRTAPSEISKTDYEHSLKLSAPVLLATSPSADAEARKRQKNPSQSDKKLGKLAGSITNKNVSNKISSNVGSNLSTTRNKIISKSKLMSPSSSSNKMIKQQQSRSVDKMGKATSTRRDRKRMGEIEQLESRKREMARLRDMFKYPMETLGDIEPAVLPGELQATRQLEEERADEMDDSAIPTVEEESDVRQGPCGWRTGSEQELAAKKTLAYLCEPDYPLEMMAIRPGGRPCECRENRSKKKILEYAIGGLVEKDRRGARRRKFKEENRIIEGVVYFTPPPSPRRSDEYIPEYELLESPYEMCSGEVTDGNLKLIEKYSGPKSLIKRARKTPKSCNCGSGVSKKAPAADQKKDIEEARRKLMESMSPEERWAMALKDAALMDYFTQRGDKTLCWTSCRKFSRGIRPRRLKMVKPVCECRNERKIVERNEERSRWKMRQRRLKDLKKRAFMHVVDTSRPMVEDTKLIISEVQRIPGKTKAPEHESDVEYCISGVTKDLAMSPALQVFDGLKMSTPFETPEPSKEKILPAAPHRHWSPMNIPAGPLPRKDASLKEEMCRRKKARDEASMLIYGDVNIERDSQKRLTQSERSLETLKSHASVEEKASRTAIKSPSEKIDKIEYRQGASSEIIVNEVMREDEKHREEAPGKIDYRTDASHKQIIERTGEKTDKQSHQITDSNDKKHVSGQFNLMTIMKAELQKMSEEGYVFANLPECHLMPQLRHWITFRNGIAFSEIKKKNMMRTTFANWHLIDAIPMSTIKSPSLNMTNRQLRRLTFDQADRTRKKIKEEKAIFHSKVRKARVSYARTFWSTMEYGKFPCQSFKRAYFTYMAGKEADGHVYRPWLTSEGFKRDPDFSCYH